MCEIVGVRVCVSECECVCEIVWGMNVCGVRVCERLCMSV